MTDFPTGSPQLKEDLRAAPRAERMRVEKQYDKLGNTKADKAQKAELMLLSDTLGDYIKLLAGKVILSIQPDKPPRLDL